MHQDDIGPPEDQNSWAVTDTETTGMKEHDQVIEWGITGPEHVWKVLFKPTVPIHCEARASHNITDKELATASPFAEWLERNGEFKPFGTARYFVAHNAEFDIRLLKQTGLPPELLPPKVICTLICARHLWPTADSFKNQALRYYFNLAFTAQEQKLMRASTPHRVVYDTIITRALLRLMLKDNTLADLEELTRKPFLLHTITIGKHRGKLFSEVDKGWLQWVLDQGELQILPDGSSKGFDKNTRYTAQYYLNQAA